jgi:membrane-associated protease RseP (regulator of RpoE activity)
MTGHSVVRRRPDTRAARFAIVIAGVLVAAPLTAQSCPVGRPVSGDIGIRGVRCAGPAASCAINVDAQGGSRDVGDVGEVRQGSGVRHVFAVEPVVTELSGAAGEIVVGDTLVAIDGMLITTAAGGRRLARIRTGEVVALLIRRNGQLLEQRLEAVAGCGITSLRVSR